MPKNHRQKIGEIHRTWTEKTILDHIGEFVQNAVVLLVIAAVLGAIFG